MSEISNESVAVREMLEKMNKEKMSERAFKNSKLRQVQNWLSFNEQPIPYPILNFKKFTDNKYGPKLQMLKDALVKIGLDPTTIL